MNGAMSDAPTKLQTIMLGSSHMIGEISGFYIYTEQVHLLLLQ